MMRGRFAPSPTGALHAGSLVAALASWLDARAHGGVWLVRIEDVDTPRCVPGADAALLAQLAACGLVPDEPPVWQSQRAAHYQGALDQLVQQGLAYPCACSRKDIEDAWATQGQARSRHGELVYPGTCRQGLRGRPARAWRLQVDEALARWKDPFSLARDASVELSAGVLRWTDRRLGLQKQDVVREVGDFVLRRADGLFAYQLAVVVDDAAQGITHVVRGEDLADNTPRQLLLQNALGLPAPRYLHTPLVMGPDGHKLSKQNGALPLDVTHPLTVLMQAAVVLGLPAGPSAGNLVEELARQVMNWRQMGAGESV